MKWASASSSREGMECPSIHDRRVAPAQGTLCHSTEFKMKLHNFGLELTVPRFYGVDPDTRRHTLDFSVAMRWDGQGAHMGTQSLVLCEDSRHSHLYILECLELRQCNGTHDIRLRNARLQLSLNGTPSAVCLSGFGRTDWAILWGRPEGINSTSVQCFAQAQGEEVPEVEVRDGKPASPFSLYSLIKMNMQPMTTQQGNANALGPNGRLHPSQVQRAASHWSEFRDRYNKLVGPRHLPGGVLTLSCVGQDLSEEEAEALKAQVIHLQLRVVVVVIE